MPRIITRDKAFHVIKSSKYDGYQRGPGSMVYKFFDKNFTATFGNKMLSTQEKRLILKISGWQKNFTMQFLRNLKMLLIADLTDIELTNRYNNTIRLLLCFFEVLVNMHDLFLLNSKKQSVVVNNAFQRILNGSGRKANIPGHKPNKIWVDNGSEFCNIIGNHGYMTTI